MSMTITLTSESEELVSERVTSGAYQSANEVIAASLRLLAAQEKGMETLRREILRGVEDIEEGRFITCQNDAELDAFAAGIINQDQEKTLSLKDAVMRTVKVTATAEADLRQIWNYVAKYNPEAAGKLIREIIGKFALLRDQPLVGREQNKLLVNLRSFVVKNYFIFTSRLRTVLRFSAFCTVHETLKPSSKGFLDSL